MAVDNSSLTYTPPFPIPPLNNPPTTDSPHIAAAKTAPPDTLAMMQLVINHMSDTQSLLEDYEPQKQ